MDIGELVSSNENEASCSSDQSTVFNSKDNYSDGSGDENETYFFESDHLALKGNHDYQMMLRLIAILESQRIQAVKDLEKLHECQAEALADPIQFVDKLQRGIDIGLPKPQKVQYKPYHQIRGSIRYRFFLIFTPSRKHAYIILTPLNPTFI